MSYSKPMAQQDGIYNIDESAVADAPSVMRAMRWPLAGSVLSDDMRKAYGLPTLEQEKSVALLHRLTNKQKALAESQKKLSSAEAATLKELLARDDLDIQPVKVVRIPHTHHDYTVARNHLVPYYPPEKESLSRRKETQIIARSRAWIMNAMPQLNVPWNASDIEHALVTFRDSISNVDPSNTNALNEKSAEFRLIFGAIMTRFEFLGRAIVQRNTYGTMHVAKPLGDGQQLNDEQLSDEQIKLLEAEYKRYYTFLNSKEVEPLLRLALLTDMKIDRDGVLIDYLREIGKPIRVVQDSQARHINDLIVDKVGSAMESIDETHRILRRAMTEGESAKLFKVAADEFVLMHGAEYGLRSTDDIIQKLDDYATLCKARTGIKGEDATAYRETYTKLAALEAFFNNENGLLQSMKRASRGHSKDIADLRQLTTRGIKLMMRTAYTRIPSNADAPSVWIPNLDDDAPPLERNLARQFLTKEERSQARKILAAADGIDGFDRERYLNQQFSSVGCLDREMKQLEESIAKNNSKLADKQATGRTGRG